MDAAFGAVRETHRSFSGELIQANWTLERQHASQYLGGGGNTETDPELIANSLVTDLPAEE